MMGFSQWLLSLGYPSVTQNPAGLPEEQQMHQHGIWCSHHQQTSNKIGLGNA